MRDNSLVNPKIYFETLNELINIDPTLGRVSMEILCIDNVDTIKMMYDRYKDRCDFTIVDNEGTIEVLKAFFGEDTEGVTYIIYKKDEELESEKGFWKNMKFDYIIMNPPFNNANKVWDKAREHSSNPVVCLGPLSMYKGDNRYEYIDTFKVVDASLFEDAEMADNLCITTSRKSPNKNSTYLDYLFETFDDNFMEFYNWNRKNFIGLCVVRQDNKSINDFNREIDFITSSRGCNYKTYFATNDGIDYIYNYTDNKIEKVNSGLNLIRFNSKISKHNFCVWAYYKSLKERLLNKVTRGLHLMAGSEFCSYAIPQIDWEAISDYPLWIEGKYDEAVLDTMGLKWNETKTGVVKK